ncbi:MAG: pyrimidine 5'-nucleotidase [Chakrabartia sp.]
MTPALSHVDTWVFDLDNTLYPASCDLFALIDARMNLYLQKLFNVDHSEAHRIQKSYFHEHGTTLSGLMMKHGTDPHHFLDFVHDIDLDRVSENPALRDAICGLPGRKLVFTNGDVPYAERVLSALGLGGCFEAVHDIHAMDYRPKPDPSAYDGFCRAWGIRPATALFAEDMARNLKPAKDIGMTTLWVNNGSEQAGSAACPSYIDHETHEITAWLQALNDKDAQ